jgi:hypothetical protein
MLAACYTTMHSRPERGAAVARRWSGTKRRGIQGSVLLLTEVSGSC